MNKKTLVAIILLIIFCISLCACGEDAVETEDKAFGTTEDNAEDSVFAPSYVESDSFPESTAGVQVSATPSQEAEELFETEVTAVPSQNEEDPFGDVLVWIPTNGGQKYHDDADCSDMRDPEQCTKAEAEKLGFTACKKCYK